MVAKKNYSSIEKILFDTSVSALTSAVPVNTIINKNLSGKHLKLNKVERFVKRLTDSRYVGKHLSALYATNEEIFTTTLKDSLKKHGFKTIRNLFM